jgi:RNA polymerase sigma-70 factor (ECF subfamily)
MALSHAVPDVAADPTDAAAGRMSDASLVSEVMRGSQQALATLYDRHADAVHAAAMRLSNDSWIAAEVVQETFLALWNRAELYDPTRGPLTAWLQRIARNRTVDHHRAAGRHHRAATFSAFHSAPVDDHVIDDWLTRTGELVAMSRPEPVPDAALSAKETHATIADALATLDPRERSLIQLAYGNGLSQSEIAARLDLPLGTVKTRTRRALRLLRERLEQPLAVATSAAVPAPCLSPCV